MEMMVLMDQEVQPVHQALLVVQVRLVMMVTVVPKALLATTDAMVPLVMMVTRDRRVTQVVQVLLVLMVIMVALVQTEPLVHRDLRV
jgi:hypothetical protein